MRRPFLSTRVYSAKRGPGRQRRNARAKKSSCFRPFIGDMISSKIFPINRLFSGRLQLLGIVLLVFITCLGRWQFMSRTGRRNFLFWFPLSWLFLCPHGSWAVEPSVQIQSPKDGSRIVQDQNSVLVSGKVSTQGTRTPNVDIFFVVDVSGSTAHYAGVDFGDSADLSLPADPLGSGRPQIRVFGSGFGVGE